MVEWWFIVAIESSSIISHEPYQISHHWWLLTIINHYWPLILLNYYQHEPRLTTNHDYSLTVITMINH